MLLPVAMAIGNNGEDFTGKYNLHLHAICEFILCKAMKSIWD